MAILGSTIIKGRLKVNGTINGYTLNTAASYASDSTISGSATGIPTSQAIVNYVTSAINTWKTNNARTNSNITISQSGTTITATTAAGYYASDTSKNFTLTSAVFKYTYTTTNDGPVAFISCTTAGYCPLGVIEPVDTTNFPMDKVSYTLGYSANLYSGSSYSGGTIPLLTTAPSNGSYAAKATISVQTLDPGYVLNVNDINTTPFYIPTASVNAEVNSSTPGTVTPGVTPSGFSFLSSGTSAFAITPTASQTTGTMELKVLATLNDPNIISSAGLVPIGTIIDIDTEDIPSPTIGNGTVKYLKAGSTTVNTPTVGTTTTTISGTNATFSSTNSSGIIVSSSTTGTVSATATVTEGYQLASTPSNTSGTISASGSSYLTAITVPKDKTFSVTMAADTAQDTTSNLTITNAAYRAIAINGGDTDKGVLINGANGKTVTVDTVQVTNANGDLTTTSRSAGSTTITSDYLTTTNTGYTVTAYGSVSTGTGWISSGSTNSTTATRYVKAGTAGAVTGGALTHGATSFSAGSDYLTTTNTGYTITATNTASVSAASYSITTAGWIASAGAGTTASGNDVKTITRYIKAGEAHNGYVTTAGWIPKDTSVYTLTYDSTNQRVDFVFNDA